LLTGWGEWGWPGRRAFRVAGAAGEWGWPGRRAFRVAGAAGEWGAAGTAPDRGAQDGARPGARDGARPVVTTAPARGLRTAGREWAIRGSG